MWKNLTTPLIPLTDGDSSVTVWAKLESIHPTGSIKDRIAFFILENAIKSRELRPGMPVIEASSGNTAVSLAYASSQLGFEFIAVVPPSTSRVKVHKIKRYGGEVVNVGSEEAGISPGDFEQVRKKVDSLANELGGYTPNQFSNHLNSRAHFLTTGAEIWEQMDGKIDAFVAGYGTGGTLMGVGEKLLDKDGDVWVIAVEPGNSTMLSGGKPSTHRIYGLADGFIPEILDKTIISGVETVGEDEAYETAFRLFRDNGLVVGPSGGANVAVAMRIASKLRGNARVVTVLPDSGYNYIGDEAYQSRMRDIFSSIEDRESRCCA